MAPFPTLSSALNLCQLITCFVHVLAVFDAANSEVGRTSIQPIKILLKQFQKGHLCQVFCIGVNAAGVTGVRTPPIFDLQGSINVLDPRNNSHTITCTMH